MEFCISFYLNQDNFQNLYFKNGSGLCTSNISLPRKRQRTRYYVPIS